MQLLAGVPSRLFVSARYIGIRRDAWRLSHQVWIGISVGQPYVPTDGLP